MSTGTRNAARRRSIQRIDVPIGWLLVLGAVAYALAAIGWYLAIQPTQPGIGGIVEALYRALSVLAPSDAYTSEELNGLNTPAVVVLMIARWVGAFFFALTVAKVALNYFWQGILKRWAQHAYEDHIVIIGDHEFAREAAEEAADRELKVIHFKPGGQETVHDGILTQDSDIGLDAMLDMSSAHRARSLVFATRNNAENGDMARTVFNDGRFTKKAREASEKGTIAQKARAGPHIFVFTSDSWYERREELDYGFHRPPADTAMEGALDSVVEIIGESRAAARAVMTAEPVYQLQVGEFQHIILVGFGTMGEAVLAEFCETQRTHPQRKPRITILDPDPGKWASFTARCPGWAEVFDGVFFPNRIDQLGDAEDTFTARLREAPPSAIYVSTGDAADPMAAAAEAKRVIASMAEDGQLPEERIGCPIFVCVRGGNSRLDGGVADRINDQAGHPVLKRLPIVPFGAWRDVVSASRVLDDEPDLAAFLVHETHHGIYGKGPSANWSHVAEVNRYSSRSAANFVPALLHAAGFDLRPWLAPQRDGTPPSVNILPRLAPSEQLAPDASTLVKLARLEHARWCAERYLRGFQYGETKDLDRKRHPGLKPFDAIDRGSKSYNIKYIDGLEDMLLQPAEGTAIARGAARKRPVMRPTDFSLVRDAGLDPQRPLHPPTTEEPDDG